MSLSRLLAAGILAGVWIFVFGFNFHWMALMKVRLASLPMLHALVALPVWAFLARTLLLGLVMACVYHFGYEAGKSPAMQGLRFGLLIGLLSYLSAGLEGWAFRATPFWLQAALVPLGWILTMAVAGILIAAIYTPRVSPPEEGD
jgi:hypothetical protein